MLEYVAICCHAAGKSDRHCSCVVANGEQKHCQLCGDKFAEPRNPDARVTCLQADPAYLDDEHELKDRQMLSML